MTKRSVHFRPMLLLLAVAVLAMAAAWLTTQALSGPLSAQGVWQHVGPRPLDPQDYGRRVPLGVSPAFATDGTVFAGTNVGVFRSTDAGDTWEQVTQGHPSADLGPGRGQVYVLGLSPAFDTDGTVFAGTHGGMFRSTDGGDTWEEVTQGLPSAELGPRRGQVSALGLSPAFDTDRTVFAGNSVGVFRSTDSGDTWEQVGQSTISSVRVLGLSPAFDTDGTIFAGNSVGVFRSTDAGQTWEQVTQPTISVGVFRSTDAGPTLEKVSALGLSPAFATDGTVFAGTDDGVFRSTDGGDTWEQVSRSPISSVGALGLSPAFATDGTLFAGTSGGVFRTSDPTPVDTTSRLTQWGLIGAAGLLAVGLAWYVLQRRQKGGKPSPGRRQRGAVGPVPRTATMIEERDGFEELGSQRYARGGLLNLFPGFGLGYLKLHRRTAFRISVGFWLVLSLIGFVAGLVNPGASAFSLRETLTVSIIAALMSWALVAVISADHLLIAAMKRGWRTKGAWSRLAVIMGMSAVLMGSFIYFVGAMAGAIVLGLWGFNTSLV